MKRPGIKAKVALTAGVASALTIMLLTALQLVQMRDDFRSVLFDQQSALVGRTAEELDDKLSGLQALLVRAAAGTPRALLAEPQALRHHHEQSALLAAFDDLLVLDREGRILADAPLVAGRVGISAADRDFFKQAMATGKPFISDPVLSRVRKEPIVQLVAPLLDRDGRIEALLVGVLRLNKDNLLGHLRTAKVGRTGYYFAITRGAVPVYVVYPDPARILQPRPPNANAATTRALNEGFEGSLETVNSMGVHAISSYRQLKSVSWVIGASLPAAEAFGPIDAALRRLALWGGGAAVLAAVLVGWLTMRLLEPVVRLRDRIGALRAQGAPFTPLSPGRRDEVGELTEAFNDVMLARGAAEAQLRARGVELELERDRADAANRAKSEFVANMSHEIRTPLNAVLGMVYLLGNSELSEQQRKYLAMLRESGQSLLGILSDVLDFSKIEAGQMDVASLEFELDDVLGALATNMSMCAGSKHLELVIGVAAEVPQVLLGDALRLQQILVNLCSNAIKFTDAGEVALQVSVEAREGRHALLRFEVHDSGIGIDAAQQAKLFMPFSQADASITRRFGGTGLGLTICRRLVELMEGTISVRSEAGRGSCFSFTLPLQVQAERIALPALAGLGALRVLVADDNASCRRSLVELMRAWGWQADAVDSGVRALASFVAAREAGQAYHVVLTDAELPGLDGVATARALRQAAGSERLPQVILVSAFARERVQGESDAVLLQKPVTGASLLAAVHDAVKGRDRQHEAVAAVAVGAGRLDRMRLLLVEDNALNQVVARGVLEGMGATVQVLGDGRQAVDHLREHSADYDAVLMDVQMPVLDGFSATRILRAELKLTLPVIAMTAGVTLGERDHCIRAGMDDFIGKPLDVAQMLTVLERVRRPAPASASAEVFSLAHFRTFMMRDASAMAMVQKMVQSVVELRLEPVERVRAALRAGQREQAARVLHEMRGSTGNLGCKRLIAAAIAFEEQVRSDGDGDLFALLDVVEHELRAVLEQAGAWLDARQVQALR
ncbi:MAG: response regulator [Pseudomonadota bacterium]